MGKKKKRVVVDPKKLGDRFVEKSKREIEVPELNSLMGLGDGETAVIKIRQLDLNEYLSCQQGMEDQVRNLVEGIVAAAEKRGEVEEELAAAYKGLSTMAQYHIDICGLGVVEPKLIRRDWIFLANSYPLMVERIANLIIVLTQGGASLKKNS